MAITYLSLFFTCMQSNSDRLRQ